MYIGRVKLVEGEDALLTSECNSKEEKEMYGVGEECLRARVNLGVETEEQLHVFLSEGVRGARDGNRDDLELINRLELACKVNTRQWRLAGRDMTRRERE